MSGHRTNQFNRNYGVDVEYIAEVHETFEDRYLNCKKHELHSNYIAFDQIKNNKIDQLKTLSDLLDLSEFLETMANLTVLIWLEPKKIYSNLSNLKSGTAFIHKIRRVSSQNCPCPECFKETHQIKPFAILTLSTVAHVFSELDVTPNESHVIKTVWDKNRITAKLFYNRDNDDVDSLPTLYGHELLDTDKDANVNSDWCAIECVTHDMSLTAKLEGFLKTYESLQAEIYQKCKTNDKQNIVVIMGHPHGGPKRMSVGRYDPSKIEVLKQVRNYQRWCRYNYEIITCPGCSGAPIFTPGQSLCGFGYWFGHPHNHAQGDPSNPQGCSSVGVEHIDVEK